MVLSHEVEEVLSALVVPYGLQHGLLAYLPTCKAAAARSRAGRKACNARAAAGWEYPALPPDSPYSLAAILDPPTTILYSPAAILCSPAAILFSPATSLCSPATSLCSPATISCFLAAILHSLATIPHSPAAPCTPSLPPCRYPSLPYP